MPNTSLAALAMKMQQQIDFSDAAQLRKMNGFGFGLVGENFVGIRQMPAEKMAFNSRNTQLIGPKGIVCPDNSGYGMHITFSGTPHHTRHMFGYWHINDVDEIYIKSPGTGPDGEDTMTILMRRPLPGERDYFAWYCQQCANLIWCQPYDSGNLQQGFIGLLEAEDHAIKTFNRDPAGRRCDNCGWEHPLAYRFWEPHNTPAEEAARATW